MEDFPGIIRTETVPLCIDVPPYIMDHNSRGTVLFPAVETMECLAQAAGDAAPELDIMAMDDVRFDRFIVIEPGRRSLEALCMLEHRRDGTVKTVLATRTQLKSGISRVKEHASAVFGKERFSSPLLPLDVACSLEGIAFEVAAEDLYRDLVPFGPAFRNITGALWLTREGALGRVSGGADVPRSWKLGPSFALDAAFHAACAWAQRYTGIVAFPVGLASRKIHARIKSGEVLVCRVLPVDVSGEDLLFDIHLFRDDGERCETVIGVAMKDVSGGRAAPPQWIRCGADSAPLDVMTPVCRRLGVIERRAVAPFAARTLSPLEEQRHQGMGPRRSEGFIAARLCCKRISRALSGGDHATPPDAITTIDDAMVRPRCPGGQGEGFCSVSHDGRFAFAASADRKIGVDVEVLAERVLRGQRFYMTEDEMALAGAFSAGAIAGSLRVWSIKECVAKALDLKLYEAWRQSEVTRIGVQSSTVLVNDGAHEAFHAAVDDHLFTVLVLNDDSGAVS